MADPFPRRTDTSSTVASEQTARDSDITFHNQPVTPTRTRTGPRRVTLSHRKLVFCDPIAFRYLEEDDSTIVLARRERLQGYELYIVEQWVCSRIHPTFVIATYTGDASHSILVNVLAIPHEETNWSRRLKVYFDAVSQFQAREQETPLGTITTTNLSAFPSSLTVISVPDGDVKKHREDFIVNENLKRMGCTGRAAMNLQPAPPSTKAKFQNLYQVSESIPFQSSVMELVRLCQTALVLYGKLNSTYADGLLCDITEQAIHDWWNDIGTDFHNLEPSDGVLGPTTVSAMIGLMIGAYNRIRSTGINVPKDVLDVLPMKRAIGHFQKAHKVAKTRRLDRDTLDRLHRVTAKTANSEGWAVPRAVKSTVAELSGKGGEMVMGAIGANKEKVAISEIETLEIDKLSQLVPGAKMKWLWQGKPLKSSRGDVFGTGDYDGLNGRVFSTDEQGNFIWTSGARGSLAEGDNGDENVIQDRSSLRRLGDAVGIPGLRSHHTRLHKHNEEHAEREDYSTDPKLSRASSEYSRPTASVQSPSSSYARSSLDRTESKKPALGLALANADAQAPKPLALERTPTKLQAARRRADSGRSMRREVLRAANAHRVDMATSKRTKAELQRYRDQIKGDQYQNFVTEFEEGEPETAALRRSKSALQLREIEAPIAYSLRLPRQMSFSLVETSVLKLPAVQDEAQDTRSGDNQHHHLASRLSKLEAREVELKQLTAHLLNVEHHVMLLADAEVLQVEALDQESREHLTELNDIYYQRLDEYQSLQATSRDLVAREKASLNDGLRKIDMLGQRLDYELDALQSRVQEVEDGTVEFERNVVDIEARVAELIHERPSDNPEHADEHEQQRTPWFQKALSFFGSK